MAGRQLLRPATGSRQHTASLCSPLNRYLSFYIGNRLRERERHAIPLVCRCRSIGSSLLLDRRDAGYSHRHPSFGEETIDGWIPVSLPFNRCPKDLYKRRLKERHSGHSLQTIVWFSLSLSHPASPVLLLAG
jgi:hypothetical protein